MGRTKLSLSEFAVVDSQVNGHGSNQIMSQFEIWEQVREGYLNGISLRVICEWLNSAHNIHISRSSLWRLLERHNIRREGEVDQ